MAVRERPYHFYDVAISICSTCFRKVEGKIIFQDDNVYLLKRCPRHGAERVLVSDDVPYYRSTRENYLKRPEQPARTNTPVRWGCPYDCGLCPDHEQHSCVSIIEIADLCNLQCPVCYAESGPLKKIKGRQPFKTLQQIERMLDVVVENEIEPDVVQLSGGEPTIHPEFFAIMDAARKRPIRHLMVNTNGVRLANDRDFAAKLAAYVPGFELYLQFDSLQAGPLLALRGEDLRDVHERALAHCEEFSIPVTLVMTVKKGLNDDEIGTLIEFALTKDCVRGVTLQPIQEAGRLEGYKSSAERLTLSQVRRKILEQTDVFSPGDVIPVPCHPDAIAMAYALKHEGQVIPLTGLVSHDVLIDGARNTITFEKDPELRAHLFDLFSTHHSLQSRAESLRELLCCLPRIDAPETWGYEKLFRVIIMEFIDARNFDVRSVKKSCVHIVTDDGRMIPFDTYNLFYRGNLEQTRLQPLREEIA